MRNNKLFVKTMIITAVIGFTALLISMFIGIKIFTEDRSGTGTDASGEAQHSGMSTAFTSTVVGLVEEVSKDSVKVLDIDKNQYMDAAVKALTQVQDAYGNPMPLENIKRGDVVEVLYEPDKGLVKSISKAKEGWIKSDIKNVDIDTSNQKLYIGESMYFFSDHTMILGSEGEDTTIHHIGKYDTLELIGIGDKVYSIKVLELQGTIEIGKLPSYEGVVEIDINRQINLQNLNGPIPVAAGKHKVVLKMEGYDAIVQEVEVMQGKNVVIIPENPQMSQTELIVELLNNVTNYTVEIDGATYTQDETIKVKQGNYRIKINAEGFKSWVGALLLKEPMVRLQVTLEPLAQEETTVTTPAIPDTSTDVSPDYSINISTDPDNAKVYIDGEYKGMTPYNTTLPIGDYSVLLQKEGYEDYTTSLIIDNSDNQNSHLYVLTLKE